MTKQFKRLTLEVSSDLFREMKQYKSDFGVSYSNQIRFGLKNFLLDKMDEKHIDIRRGNE